MQSKSSQSIQILASFTVTISALIFFPACDSSTGTHLTPPGGAKSGGTPVVGGVTTLGGVVSSSGGTIASVGGVTASAGAMVSATSGATASSGGVTTSSGGTTTNFGGSGARPGGMTTSSGGAPTNLGGSGAGPGGVTTSSGRTTTNLGGSGARPGGMMTSSGGRTTNLGGSGAGLGGLTTSSNATAAGGRTGTSGGSKTGGGTMAGGSTSAGGGGAGGAGGIGTGGSVGVITTSTNLCDGLVQDKAAHPMTALAKPGLLQTVTDPQFGTTIRRITNVGGTGVIKPLYSPTQAWSADERYLLLYEVGHGHRLYDGKTYAFMKDLDISPADIEQVYWDTTDPDIFYYVDGVKLIRYHVAASQKEVYHTIPNCQSQATADSHAWISWDSRFLCLQCEDNGTSFIYRIDTGTVVGSTTATPDLGAPSIGASGTLARWDTNVVDDSMHVVRAIDIPVAEHSSLGRIANGDDTYNAVQFDPGPHGSAEGTLVVHDMTDGTSRVIVGPSTGYPYPPSGTHVSAVVYRNAGWVFVSVVGDTSGAGVLDQALLLANTNLGSTVVCRIGHHRSWGDDGPNAYWAEPHVTGSPTGTRAVFGSDWGGGATVDTYVVELPSYSPQ